MAPICPNRFMVSCPTASKVSRLQSRSGSNPIRIAKNNGQQEAHDLASLFVVSVLVNCCSNYVEWASTDALAVIGRRVRTRSAVCDFVASTHI